MSKFRNQRVVLINQVRILALSAYSLLFFMIYVFVECIAASVLVELIVVFQESYYYPLNDEQIGRVQEYNFDHPGKLKFIIKLQCNSCSIVHTRDITALTI